MTIAKKTNTRKRIFAVLNFVNFAVDDYCTGTVQWVVNDYLLAIRGYEFRGTHRAQEFDQSRTVTTLSMLNKE